MSNILAKIMENENILITPEAQQFVLDVSANSAKVMINYMEKFHLLGSPIDVHVAQQVCTNICFEPFDKFTSAILHQNLELAIHTLYTIYDSGYSVMDILDSYFTYIKVTNSLNDDQKYTIIPFICEYIAVFHNVHEDEIELALFSNSIIKSLRP